MSQLNQSIAPLSYSQDPSSSISQTANQPLSQPVFQSSQAEAVQIVPDLSPPSFESQPEWSQNEKVVIEQIVDKRRHNGKTEYFVKWVGWGHDHCSWKEYNSAWDTQDQQKALDYERELVKLVDVVQVETQDSIDTLCEPIPWMFSINDLSNQQLTQMMQQTRPTGMKQVIAPFKDTIIQLISQNLAT
jgi:hypothetical protein